MKANKAEKSAHRALVGNADKRNNIESKQWRKAKRKLNQLKSKTTGIGRKRRGAGSQEGSGLMDAIRSLYFFSHVNRLKTGSVVFRLHGLTAAILLLFSITISTRQAVGNPIDCDHTREIPVNVFNAFCWVHSTYFVTGAMLGLSGINVAYPGVGQTRHHSPQLDQSGVVKQVKYYQWVAFTLFFQLQYNGFWRCPMKREWRTFVTVTVFSTTLTLRNFEQGFDLSSHAKLRAYGRNVTNIMYNGYDAYTM